MAWHIRNRRPSRQCENPTRFTGYFCLIWLVCCIHLKGNEIPCFIRFCAPTPDSNVNYVNCGIFIYTASPCPVPAFLPTVLFFCHNQIRASTFSLAEIFRFRVPHVVEVKYFPENRGLIGKYRISHVNCLNEILSERCSQTVQRYGLSIV